MGGLCTKCHDAESTSPAPCSVGTPCGVKYYYKTGSYTATPPHDGGGSLRNRCSDCHLHPIGCGGCHNSPPTSGIHDRHNQLPIDSQVVNYTATTPEATETQYGFRCVKCHNGGSHANQAGDTILGKSSGNPYQVELNFDTAADPKNPRRPRSTRARGRGPLTRGSTQSGGAGRRRGRARASTATRAARRRTSRSPTRRRSAGRSRAPGPARAATAPRRPRDPCRRPTRSTPAPGRTPTAARSATSRSRPRAGRSPPRRAAGRSST